MTNTEPKVKFTQTGVLYRLKYYSMQYKCCTMNVNSGKARPFLTHKERIEGNTAAFTNRTKVSDREYISTIQIFMKTSKKMKFTCALMSTSHS
jgi:hypothetical protein